MPPSSCSIIHQRRAPADRGPLPEALDKFWKPSSDMIKAPANSTCLIFDWDGTLMDSPG